MEKQSFVTLRQRRRRAVKSVWQILQSKTTVDNVCRNTDVMMPIEPQGHQAN